MPRKFLPRWALDTGIAQYGLARFLVRCLLCLHSPSPPSVIHRRDERDRTRSWRILVYLLELSSAEREQGHGVGASIVCQAD